MRTQTVSGRQDARFEPKMNKQTQQLARSELRGGGRCFGLCGLAVLKLERFRHDLFRNLFPRLPEKSNQPSSGASGQLNKRVRCHSPVITGTQFLLKKGLPTLDVT
jgi:hypothetical protein